MSQTTWTIHTKSNGTINVDHITNQPPKIKRGNTVNITAEVGNVSLIQDYIEYGGSYSTLEGLNGEIFYGENVPSAVSIDSIVFGIEPNTELSNRNVFGIWGILNSASDNRPRATTTNLVGLNMLVLARYSDYADHTALENDLLMSL